ncbi:MAG TPA: hypothetical protein VMB73_11120, partial [Acetobacteraceae bacterium]|nr:hypothetical protein [Acetobacteraceae bacterium]
MTQFTLSGTTQAAINLALQNGGNPGTNNANYVVAYQDIYNDILAYNAANPTTPINAGTTYWFSEAGNINSQAFAATPAGSFIWAYTQAAAASEGYTVTATNLLTASKIIAGKVFQDLAADNFVFSDANQTGDFAPQQIVATDAGAGIQYLQSLYPGLDYAIWGGTLATQSTLDDPTYAQTYGLNLTAGSTDCQAIVAGDLAGLQAAAATLFGTTLLNNPSLFFNSIPSGFQSGGSILAACIGDQPLFQDGVYINQYGEVTSQTVNLAGGGTGSVSYAYNASAQVTQATVSDQTAASGPTITDAATINPTTGNTTSQTIQETSATGSPGDQIQINLGPTGDTTSATVTNPNDDPLGNFSLSGTPTISIETMVGTLSATTGSNLLIDPGFGGTLIDYASSNTFIDLSSGGSVATGSDAQVGAFGDNTTVTNAGTGSSDWVDCDGDIVNSNSGTIDLGDSDSDIAIGGSSDLIGLGSDDSLSLTSGTGNTITGDVAGDDVGLDSNTSATISGSGGEIDIDGTGINLTASGETIDEAADGACTLDGSGNAIDASGAGASIDLLAGSSDNSFAASTAYVTDLGNGDSAWVGSGTVDFAGTGANFAIGDNSDVMMGGSENATNLGSGSTLIMNGISDTVWSSPTIDATIGGSGNDLWGASTLIATVGGQYNLVSAGDDSVVDVTGTDDSGGVDNFSTLTISGSGNGIGLGDDSTLFLGGESNTVWSGSIN